MLSTLGGVERACIILCPLEIEREAVARAVGNRARVVRTGPGPGAVRAAVMSLLDDDDGGVAGVRALVLAGLAGGLVETSGVIRVDGVCDERGRAWTPRVVARGDGPGVMVVGVDEPVLTTGEKRALGGKIGAGIVDTESHVFAEVCEDLGVRWGVVRAVSDGPEDVLPGRVVGWISSEGRTRVGRVALDLIRRPGMIPGVIKLGRRSRRALRELGFGVVAMLGACEEKEGGA